MVNVSVGTGEALVVTLKERLRAGNFASLVAQRREAPAASGWMKLSWPDRPFFFFLIKRNKNQGLHPFLNSIIRILIAAI